MTTFVPIDVSPAAELDVRAHARSKMFFALRKAFKVRSASRKHLSKELAEAIHKDQAFVSRVLNGTNKTMDFETLALFMSGLGYNVDLDVKSYEELKSRRCNFDARPLQPIIKRSNQKYSNEIIRSNSNARNGNNAMVAGT